MANKVLFDIFGSRLIALKGLLGLRDEFKKHRVRLVLVNQFFPKEMEGTPEAELFLNNKAGIDQYMREVLIRNMANGRQTRAEKRLPSGGMTAFGYRRISEVHAGRLEPDPDEAPIVKRIFQRCVDGLSTRAIARELTADRVPTRLDRKPTKPRPSDEGDPPRRLHKTTPYGTWQSRTVYAILANETYVGRAFYGKNRRDGAIVSRQADRSTWIEIPTEPLISSEIFEQAQQALQRNKETSWARGQKKHFYLLIAPGAKLLTCGRCGRPVRGVVDRRGTQYYRCISVAETNIPRDQACKGSVKAEILDAQAWTALVNFLKDPQRLINHTLDEFTTTEAKSGELYQKVRYLDQQIAGIAIKLQRWDDAFEAGAITVGDLKEKRLALAAERKELERGKEDTQAELDAVYRNLGDLDAVLNEVLDVYLRWNDGPGDLADLRRGYARSLKDRSDEIQARLDAATLTERQRLLAAFHVRAVWNPEHPQKPLDIRGAVDVQGDSTASIVTHR